MMDAALLEFLANGGVTVDGLELRPLSAWALVQARAEAARLAGSEEALGLYENACILARAAHRNGVRSFSDAQAVMQTLTAEQIERLMEHYAAACAPGRLDATAREQLRTALGDSAQERLRWRVLRAFGVLPTEARAREMTQDAYLLCAMHLTLDEEERLAGLCPTCRELARTARCSVCGAALPEQNAAFDDKRFEELRRGGIHSEPDAQTGGTGGGV